MNAEARAAADAAAAAAQAAVARAAAAVEAGAAAAEAVEAGTADGPHAADGVGRVRGEQLVLHDASWRWLRLDAASGSPRWRQRRCG